MNIRTQHSGEDPEWSRLVAEQMNRAHDICSKRDVGRMVSMARAFIYVGFLEPLRRRPLLALADCILEIAESRARAEA